MDPTNIINDGSFEQKLEMVAGGLMDPKTIGLTDPTEAAAKLLEKKDPSAFRKFGDFLQFEASEIPIQIRALWALQELKVVPINTAKWQDEWAEEHKAEHVIQCRFRSGTALATLERTVTDTFPGMLILMEDAVKLFRDEYTKQQQEKNETPKSEE